MRKNVKILLVAMVIVVFFLAGLVVFATNQNRGDDIFPLLDTANSDNILAKDFGDPLGDGWHEDVNLVIWTPPTITPGLGAEIEGDLYNLRVSDDDAYIILKNTQGSEGHFSFSQFASAGDIFWCDGYSNSTINLLVFNFVKVSSSLIGTLNSTRQTITHVFSSEEIGEGTCFIIASVPVWSYTYIYSMNANDTGREYYVPGQYKYNAEDSLLYHKYNPETMMGNRCVWIQQGWDYLNSTNATLVACDPESFINQRGYILNAGAPSWEVWFTNIPEYNMTLTDNANSRWKKGYGTCSSDGDILTWTTSTTSGCDYVYTVFKTVDTSINNKILVKAMSTTSTAYRVYLGTNGSAEAVNLGFINCTANYQIFTFTVENPINATSFRIKTIGSGGGYNGKNLKLDYMHIGYSNLRLDDFDLSGDSSDGVLDAVTVSGCIVCDCGYPNITAGNVTLKLYENDTLVASVSGICGEFSETIDYVHIEANYRLEIVGATNSFEVNYTVRKVEIDTAAWFHAETEKTVTRFLASGFYDLEIRGKWSDNTTVQNLKFNYSTDWMNPPNDTVWNKVFNVTFPTADTYSIQITPIFTDDGTYDFAILGAPIIVNITVSIADIDVDAVFWGYECFGPRDTLVYTVSLYFNESSPFLEARVVSKVMRCGVPVEVSWNIPTVFHNQSLTNVTFYHCPPLGFWTCSETIELGVYDVELNLLTYIYGLTPPFESSPTVNNITVKFVKTEYSAWESLTFNLTVYLTQNTSHHITVVCTRYMYIAPNLFHETYLTSLLYTESSGQYNSSFTIHPPQRDTVSYWLPADYLNITVINEFGAVIYHHVPTLPIVFYGNNLTIIALTPSKLFVSDIEFFTANIYFSFTCIDALPKLTEIQLIWGNTTQTFNILAQMGINNIPLLVPPSGIGCYPTNLSVMVTIPSLALSASETVDITVFKSPQTLLLESIPTLSTSLVKTFSELDIRNVQLVLGMVLSVMAVVTVGVSFRKWGQREGKRKAPRRKTITPAARVLKPLQRPPPKRIELNIKKLKI
ncbi:MAG: hypothetical protein ACQXXE_08760 [Candidatus Bathyarchaeia archaeon]|jgi:hypothetical protein